VVEIGCGPGNTVFPLLSLNKNPDLFVHALDFSSEAISIAKVSRSLFSKKRQRSSDTLF
jgi:tRNAThr (cytosine32-N3)-methyltransferase